MALLIILLIGAVIYVLTKRSQTEQMAQEESDYSFHHSAIIHGRDGFAPTRSVRSPNFPYALYFDDQRQKMMVANLTANSSFNPLVSFSEILECTIILDDGSSQPTRLRGAMIGGVLAGPVGAMVGAEITSAPSYVNSLSVRIITSNPQYSLITIPIITSKTPKSSPLFKEAFDFSQSLYASILGAMNSK